MSERLTKKDYKDWRNTHGYYNKQEVLKINENEHKLGELEDVLEKYGIDTVEELDGVLKPLIENGELENWKSAMFWKMQAEKLQSRWDELKEFVKQEIIEDNELIAKYGGRYNDGDRYLEADENILHKMQELEKEGKDDN